MAEGRTGIYVVSYMNVPPASLCISLLRVAIHKDCLIDPLPSTTIQSLEIPQ